jgi:hypothetical protein
MALASIGTGYGYIFEENRKIVFDYSLNAIDPGITVEVDSN